MTKSDVKRKVSAEQGRKSVTRNYVPHAKNTSQTGTRSCHRVESYVSKYKAQASFPKNTKIGTIRKQKKRAKPIKIPAEQGKNLFPQKI